MPEQLKDIAQISSGFYAKPGLPEEIIYLQGRDFNERYQLNKEVYPSVPLTESMQKHLLSPGDVLVASKGTHYYSIAWNRDEKAVASTHFLVVEPDKTKAIPEYLSWFINLPTTQDLLLRNARGSSVLSINRKDLGNLQIPIVPMEVQKDIVALNKLQTKESNLSNQLKTLRTSLLQRQLLKLVTDHE